MLTIAPKTQALTAQFYEWEILGRGWLLSTGPVELEAPFTPFFGHFIRGKHVIDDGVQHTLLSCFAQVFREKPKQHQIDEPPEVSYELFPFTENYLLTTLQLRFSKEGNINVNSTEQFLCMLSYCTRPISFEIVATTEAISIQFVCRTEDVHYLKSQIATYFMDVSVASFDCDPYALLVSETPAAIIDFGLRDEFMRPVRTLKECPADPFTGLFSIIGYLEKGEQVIYQVLFNGVVNPWESSILKAVTDKEGGSFFADAPEMVPLAKEKISAPLFSATVRVVAQAPTLEKSFLLLDKTVFALKSSTSSRVNALQPLTDEEYPVNIRATDMAFRQSCRAGMLLNAKELALFIHLPDSSLRSKKMIGEIRKTKALPAIAQGHLFVLGQNKHNETEQHATSSNEQRLKHTHIIGATGTGKSTLLLNMIGQDIAKGNGVAVLDPHGDLIDAVLAAVPESRINDVVLIDPSDSEYPVGFNILKAHSDTEKEVLSSDLVASFRRLSSSWGDQMNSVFANAILAFLESSKGGTLIDMRRFLIERPFREAFLKTVSDPGVRYYWQKEYPLLKTNSIGPILTRLDAFLRPRLIRNMVAQPKGVDFERVMDGKKILLVKLSQGLIGKENSYLLGTFVVSKIHQSALARQAKENRTDFFLYIDEFHHFITPSISDILSGTRKYHLGLILAHQDLQQLQRSDTELLNAVITSVGTRICFRVGELDARKLAEGLSFFDAKDLSNLGTGEAVARIERPEYDFSLSTLPFDTKKEGLAGKDAVVIQSRKNYGTSKQEVEAILNESMDEVVEETHQPIQQRAQEVPRPAKREEPDVVSPSEVALSPSIQINQDEEIKKVVTKKLETQHRYLQTLIKKIAESKGYKATIETQTPDRKGKVDVSIEGHGIRIACEVSVTTDSKWELHNVQKCLEAGYDAVVVCCVEKKSITALTQLVKDHFDEEAQYKIIITDTEGLFALLEPQNTSHSATETTFKGYRVKVEYDSVSHDVQDKKKESIAKIVLESLRRMKNK